jgi:carbamoyl-phosphate synthase small subunit
VPALFGIDTRALTKRLREKGTQLRKIVFAEDVELFDPGRVNLVKEVSILKPAVYNEAGEKTIVLVD